MRKLISKLKKHLHNNQGSSLVLVIVALAFIGILMGALLTASMAVYKLKLYDYNARDNFYYVEQGMDEIYAGVGSRTVENLQNAYSYILEHVITYNGKEYNTLTNDEANDKFKEMFMTYMLGDDSFELSDKDVLEDVLASYISNPDVELVRGKLKVEYHDLDDAKIPGTITDPDPTTLGKIVIKDVTVRRVVSYARSQASGTFSQTISTDIVIGRPDYNVNFDPSTPTINNLFDFCLVADSGVEFNETPGNAIAVAGDIYAASDFYNKRYDRLPGSFKVSGDSYSSSDETYTDELTYTVGEETFKFKMSPVSNHRYERLLGLDTNLYNKNDEKRNPGKAFDNYLYDGVNERSMYSGLYIDNNKVSVVAGKVIVPGTIAVMNTGDLSVYGVSRSNVSSGALTQVWADNMVLGGYTNSETKKGSTVLLNANVFMRDDTSIEGDGTSYKLVGSYYGYSDSTTKDTREFVPTVKTDSDGNAVYQEKNDDDQTFARGHYNSSAFIVNGERATIDFSNAKNIYLAGRSYIELSRQKTRSELREEQEVTGTTDKYDITSESYQYDTDIRDYKTGESLAVSSGQFAYLPYKAPKPVFKVTDNGVVTAEIDHYESELPVALQSAELFIKYFGAKDKICLTVPTTYQKKEINMANGTKRTKSYYYLDFEYAAKNELYDTTKFGTLGSTSDAAKDMADVLRTSFIRDYYYYLNFVDAYNDNPLIYSDATQSITYGGKVYENVDPDIFAKDDLVNVLTQIADDDAYEAGEIKLPTQASKANVYASGTIADTILSSDSTSEDKKYTYNVVMGDAVIASTLNVSDNEKSTNSTSNAANARIFSNEYGKHYNYVKWTLGDIPEQDPTAVFVDTKLVNDGSKYGEASITPLNYYLNMEMIKPDTDISMDLTGGYSVRISGGDLHLSATGGEMTGIIVAKGDVYFDNLTGDDEAKSIKKFSGIIITGGKVYVNGDVTNISSSVFCRKIMSMCAELSKNGIGTDKTNAEFVLKLFKGYEDYVDDGSGGEVGGTLYKTVSNLDYSDIVRYENWMRNVD